jgi:transposase
MSKKQAKIYGASIKAKVVLEALKNESTLAEIGSKHQIHPSNIKGWRRQFLDNIEVVFDRGQIVRNYKNRLQEKDKCIDNLYLQIGKLTAQFDWAKKKVEELGLEY